MAGEFRARGRAFPLERTYVMGILNVTPDSFSDGGKYLDPAKALARAREMERQGADIIDIGGQSTRPGCEAISAEAEWSRIQPVVEAVVSGTDIAVSVDTFYPQVAEQALAAGAHIINDVTGFGDDMFRAVSGSGCGCVVMHPCGAQEGGILAEVRAFFEERLDRAAGFGIDPGRLCFDPGIGFGKTHEDNLRLIAHVERTRLPGIACLMAASRKRVTGIPCGDPPFGERLPATIAVHTAAVLGGADIIRVHDVKEAVQAARMADALKREARRAAPWSPGGAAPWQGLGQRPKVLKKEHPMDKIHISGLELFACHGVNPEEKRDGQPFILDITLYADLSKPRRTDDLNDTVNYAAVRKTVQRAFTAESCDLIERAAQVVCEAILAEHPKVEKVHILLKKPHAPMNAKFDYVAVETELSRAPERGKLPCVPC